MTSGRVATSGGANKVITPKSPIDNAAASPIEKPTGRRNLGQIAILNRAQSFIPKLSAKRPYWFSALVIAGRIIRKEKGKDIAAFTSAVIGRAIVKGEIKGNVNINRPVPITRGEEARIRKLIISIAFDIIGSLYDILIINIDIEIAIPTDKNAEITATTIEFKAAIQTNAGRVNNGTAPRIIIDNNGKNKNKQTIIRTSISKILW